MPWSTPVQQLPARFGPLGDVPGFYQPLPAARYVPGTPTTPQTRNPVTACGAYLVTWLPVSGGRPGCSACPATSGRLSVVKSRADTAIAVQSRGLFAKPGDIALGSIDDDVDRSPIVSLTCVRRGTEIIGA
jgi:hypothetical protein